MHARGRCTIIRPVRAIDDLSKKPGKRLIANHKRREPIDDPVQQQA